MKVFSLKETFKKLWLEILMKGCFKGRYIR